MTILDRIENAFKLMGKSLKVLWKDKKLLVFPLISGTVSLILLFSLFVPLSMIKPERMKISYFFLIFFAFYFVGSFIVIFFNAALIAAASVRLKGEKPTIRYGLKVAAKNIKKILGWVLISATVGLILRWLSYIAERFPSTSIGGLIRKYLVAILGAVWSVVTFFVIPVMIFENVGPFRAFKRSIILFKETWGESLTGKFSMDIAFRTLKLLGYVMIFFLTIQIGRGNMNAVYVLVELIILYWIFIAVFKSALYNIFAASLYQHASEKKALSDFDLNAKELFVAK